MKSRLDTFLSLVLTLAAISMASAVIWHQFSPNSPFDSIRPEKKPEFFPGWKDWLIDGIPMDADSSQVVIMEFTDLECPFCAQFHRTVLKKVKETFGSAVTITFIHLPLKMHRFAEVSAVASECAAEQGRFVEYVELLFLKQDSIGLKSWGSYGLEAKVPDAAEYQRCIDDGRPVARIQAGTALAEKIGVTGTPTIFVNGWRFPTPPKEAELSRVIQDVLDGKAPFPNH